MHGCLQTDILDATISQGIESFTVIVFRCAYKLRAYCMCAVFFCVCTCMRACGHACVPVYVCVFVFFYYNICITDAYYKVVR